LVPLSMLFHMSLLTVPSYHLVGLSPLTEAAPQSMLKRLATELGLDPVRDRARWTPLW